MKDDIPINRSKNVIVSHTVFTFPEKQVNIKPTDFLMKFRVTPVPISSHTQSSAISSRVNVTHMKEYNPVSFRAVHLLYDTH